MIEAKGGALDVLEKSVLLIADSRGFQVLSVQVPVLVFVHLYGQSRDLILFHRGSDLSFSAASPEPMAAVAPSLST